MNNNPIQINEILVSHLVAAQFPQWKDLPVRAVAVSGWDNRTFHLGEHMLVRMPSAAPYAFQVEKEYQWLPILAPLLPLAIPEPLAMGEPTQSYPWKWAIYRWLEGETVGSTHIINMRDFATTLAEFLLALERIDATNGPLPGAHNFYRDGTLITYDYETRQAIAALKDKIDVETAIQVWERGVNSTWQHSPVWVHGDISAGNLLVRNGQLSAVIDFGQLGVGDPACDLAITWTQFKDESRQIFRTMLPFDADTWARGRAWALWKALIVAAGFTDTNAIETQKIWRTIDEVMTDHKRLG